MRTMLLLMFVMLSVVACQAGKLEPERQALYNKNVPNCSQNPERCINGYPW